MVRDLSWSEDGLYLVSVSDGEVYTWHMETFSRSQSSIVKHLASSAVVCTSDFATLVVGEGSQGLRIMDTKRSKMAGLPVGKQDGKATGPVRKESRLSMSIQASLDERESSSDARATSPTAVRPGTGHSSEFRVPGRASLIAAEASAAAGSAAGSLAASEASSRAHSPSPADRRQHLAAKGAPAKGAASMGAAAARAAAAVATLGMAERKAAEEAGAVGDLRKSPLGEKAMAAASLAAASLGEDLRIRSFFNSIMTTNRAGLALLENGKEWTALVGAEMLGRARVCSLPPRSNGHYQEYSLHAVEISAVAAHRNGRLLFTADVAGCWKMFAVVPRRAVVGAAALALEGESADAASQQPGKHFGPMPPFADMVAAAHRQHSVAASEGDAAGQDTQLVSVRMVDMNGLKDTVREGVFREELSPMTSP